MNKDDAFFAYKIAQVHNANRTIFDRDNYLKIWNLSVQENQNTEKIV